MITRGIKITSFIILLLVVFVKNGFSQKEIIVKQIEFKLDFISENSYENEYFVTLKFTKGIKYMFKIANHIDDYAGEAVMELLDADNLVTTNLVSNHYYDQFAFICNKTGFYDILVKFRDNKIGYSTIDIYMIQ